MCRMCDERKPNDHTDSPHDSPRGSRRNFLKASTATAVAAAGLNLLTATPAAAQANSDAPSDSGKPGRRVYTHQLRERRPLMGQAWCMLALLAATLLLIASAFTNVLAAPKVVPTVPLPR